MKNDPGTTSYGMAWFAAFMALGCLVLSILPLGDTARGLLVFAVVGIAGLGAADFVRRGRARK